MHRSSLLAAHKTNTSHDHVVLSAIRLLE